MLSKTLCLVIVSAGFVLTTDLGAANRQADNQTQQTAAQSRSSDDDDSKPLGSAGDEMRARNEIKYYEKLHQENVDRAREVAELTAKVRNVYDANKSLGTPERKNLERIEKLVRRIRSAAGGSNGDGDENSSPSDLPMALSRLYDASEALRAGVESTPRMVVSAAVIERSNELLQLLHYLRTSTIYALRHIEHGK